MYHTEVWRRCEAFDSGHFQSKLAEEKKRKKRYSQQTKNNGSSNCGERIKKKKKFCGKKISMQYIRPSTNFIDGHMR
jgi:hypothetical protein